MKNSRKGENMLKNERKHGGERQTKGQERRAKGRQRTKPWHKIDDRNRSLFSLKCAFK